MRRPLLVSLILASLLVPVVTRDTSAKGNPMVLISTSLGDIKVELYADKAPGTVKNFLQYVDAGYYNNTIFHRVIPGFMIQRGGLTADMQDKHEGQRAPIKNESSNGLAVGVGTVAMARASAPDSATSQFFRTKKNNDFLNKDKAQGGGGYAVFGKVVDGMDVVRKIEQVKTGTKAGHQNVPNEPVVIKS